MRPRHNGNILICGAGIAGPALAYWLKHYGFVPTLIEQASKFRSGGYMIDVWGTGYDLIERFALLDAVRPYTYAFDRVAFVDNSGEQVAGFGGEVLRRALDDRFFSIPRGDLACTIYDALAGQVETLYETSIESLRSVPGGVEVTMTDGATRIFDLVIGADGLRSRVRELVFGPERQFEHYLGYYAASFITENYPHRTEGVYISYARPGRQISRYAMRDGRTAFLFVFDSRDKFDVSAHDIEVHKKLIRAQFATDIWEAPIILGCLDRAEELYFDAVSQIRMPDWWRGRIALVGDAAYCPSLLAGAGSAFAMLGAYVLAGELHKAQGFHERAFNAYQDILHSFICDQQKGAARFAGSFTPRTALGLLLRNGALNAMGMPLIGEWLTRIMFGKSFTLPRYL